MADKIGILGSATTATAGTTTAYTVPTGKAAKIKLMYRGVSGISSTIKFTVDGIDIFISGALTTGHYHWSSSDKMLNSSATIPGGTTDATTVSPGPKDYYLAAGDTITYTIGTADFSAFAVHVVGTEVDVT